MKAGRIRKSIAWLLGVCSVLAGFSAALPALALDSGARAPEIGLAGPDGQGIRMADHRGKVVLVDFWASWCGPCRESFPFLERLQQRYRDRGLVVVGVSVDTREDDFRNFLEGHPVSFLVARDASHEVARRYAPPSMPTSFLVDRAGVVRHVERGYRRSSAADLERRVTRLLDETAP